MDTRLKFFLEERYVPVTESGCWIWLGTLQQTGYGSIRVRREDSSWTCKGAHRASYEVFVGEIPEGKHVLHKCNNRMCINPGHLYIGTQKDNARDAVKAGTSVVLNMGSLDKHINAKLSLTEFGEIRSLLNTGVKQKSIASMYDVDPSTISRIKTLSRGYKKWT